MVAGDLPRGRKWEAKRAVTIVAQVFPIPVTATIVRRPPILPST